MRTTVEITDEQRAKLLEMAAARGDKGFSGLVREAIELLLAHEAKRAESVAAARGLKGLLSEKEGSELEARCRDLRRHWR
jgi:metal-responsive CopG/Arc/MetJ family transcriptional regulator